MSGLIWFQTVSHSVGILDFVFEKVNDKNSCRRQKTMKNNPACGELTGDSVALE